MPLYRIGIDVGGTNTDAVLLDQTNRVIHSVKVPTTENIETGIFESIDQLLAKSSVAQSAIKYVMLGTTHATNALVQRKDLSRTAAVRICLPAGRAIEPMFTWNEALKEAIGGSVYYLHGGAEFDGRPLYSAELDEEECFRVISRIQRTGMTSIAVTSIFSPIFNSYEKAFERMVKDFLGEDFPVTLSSEIGGLGLLERENATILNAALVKVIGKVAAGLEKALKRYGIAAKIYFSQNDGTLISLQTAKRYPILTIGSGPTNSIRGAAYLTGLSDCIVCDIGGTTTDIGILAKGFPRESSIAVSIGGVETHFHMPDIISIGIGGGSIVRQENGKVTVGPDSVGFNITTESIAFGGTTLTATDCLLALGYAHIDSPACDPSRLHSINKDLCRQALYVIRSELVKAFNKIQTNQAPLPIVLVGGGAMLIQGELDGHAIIRPHNAGCANAIGAAIASVSGEADLMLPSAGKSREELLEVATQHAIQKALAAGAEPSTVTIVEIEELPIPYMTSNIIRIKAKAAGDLCRTPVHQFLDIGPA
ncbi:MAG: hydantoinase/oxoprolinase family protein [Parachlamydia sp.]|nr:hydantoinase/oxoprolinase family protein [Parachlamydia sp.]